MMKYNLKDFTITIVISLVFSSLIILFNFGISYLDYTIYRFNSKNYELVIGKVINFDYINILPARGSSDRGAIYFSKADVLYTFNGHDNIKKNLLILSDKKEGDNIMLAINDSIVRRGEPYDLSFVECIMIVWFFVGSVILLLIKYFETPNKKMHEMLIEVENKKYYKLLEEKNNKKITNKQEYILKSMECFFLDIKIDIIIDYLIDNNIYLNNACLWYIKSGIYIKDIFVNSSMDSAEECVKNTIYMRNDGMDENFYVIEKFENYCYCCSKNEESIYSYSKNVGLTKTVYFDLYDYLIEKIER